MARIGNLIPWSGPVMQTRHRVPEEENKKNPLDPVDKGL